MVDPYGKVVSAATDGACSGNPGPGGWGALLRFEDGSVEELGGFDRATTNNRMELQAALSLLERLKDLSLHPDLKIRTDSKYLIDGFEKWLHGWKLNGWRTAAGKPVLNKDLWQALDNARLNQVSFAHVKGHSGDPDNERVDQIAVTFSKGLVPKLKSLQVRTSLKMENDIVETMCDELPPIHLQHLYSRFELLDRLAQKRYSLTLDELSQLIDQPISQLERQETFLKWRDWVFEPVANQLWRVSRVQENEGV